MRIFKKYLNKHPIYSVITLYLLFSILSVSLDLLRKINLASTDFWFIIKLCILSIITIYLMKGFGFFSNKSELKSSKYKVALVPMIIFILVKVTLLVFLLCNQTNHNLGLYKLFYNFVWALGIGISEEVLCRGLLLNILKNGEYKTQKSFAFAVIISSLVFSLGHISNLFYGNTISSVCVQSIYSFIIGAYFAILYLYSGSIVLVVSLHSLYDFVGFTINDISFNNSSGLSALYFVLNCACLLLVGVVVFKNMCKLKKLYI